VFAADACSGYNFAYVILSPDTLAASMFEWANLLLNFLPQLLRPLAIPASPPIILVLCVFDSLKFSFPSQEAFASDA